jgi:class 3 adenylate cyclase
MANSESGARAPQRLLIAFGDITRFQVYARTTPELELAAVIDDFYRRVGALVRASGGRIVKFMGDAFLAVWSEESASRGVASLPAIKHGVDAFFVERGWDSRLVVKAHFAEVVAGGFGDDASYDVIGNGVNIAATLPARTIALSPEAFRLLKEEERRTWKKHTPQVIYIPVEDPRP